MLKRDLQSFEPTHLSRTGEMVPSIPVFTAELDELNQNIFNIISAIETSKDEEKRRFLLKMGESGVTFATGESNVGNSSHSLLEPVHEHDEMSCLLNDNIEHDRAVHMSSQDGYGINPQRVDDDDEYHERPMDEVVTPTHKNDGHNRDISELPINIQGAINEERVHDQTERSQFNTAISSKSLISGDMSSKYVQKDALSPGIAQEIEDHDDSSSVHIVSKSIDTNEKEEVEKKKHQRNVTFGSLKTSLSNVSNKTKGSIQSSIMKGVQKSANVVQSGVKSTATAVHGGMKKTVNIVQDSAKKSAEVMQKSVSGVKHVGAKSVKLATNLIRGSDDGKVRDGGFVTFSSLLAKAQCVQMIHHEKPFTFEVMDAPLPKDVYWNNVGQSHKKKQVGFMVAQALTIGLCLFWTIPVAFVSSLSEVDSLKKTIPSLESTINSHRWIQPLLSQLNPILMVVLKAMLPEILRKFCQREGHISNTALNASLLSKLAVFMVRSPIDCIYIHELFIHHI